MQESGPASVREAATPAAQQAPADTSASAQGRGTDRSAAYPSTETAANTSDTAQETTRALSGTGDSARNITPRTALPAAPPRRKARTRWRRIRCIPGRRQRTRCRSFAGRPAAGRGRHALARRAGR
ncbi:MAG: hypothetical protein ACLRMJ_07705 [Alistipes finegoldii]